MSKAAPLAHREPHHRQLIRKAVTLKGSQQSLADAMGCSQQFISILLNEAEQISAEMAIRCHKATDGEVPMSALRPDLFSAGGGG